MSLIRFKRSDVGYTLLLVGITAALAGFVAAVLAIRLMYLMPGTQVWDWFSIPPAVATLPLAATLAAAVLGPILWWRMIIKPGHLSVRRGIAVGALIGIITHPLIWYMALVLAFLRGQPTVAGILVSNPLQDLLAAAFLAIVSLICVGWLTALIGGVVGGVIALLQSRCGCQGRWSAALSVEDGA